MADRLSFDAVLRARLKTDPGRPLVTFYDDATGERTELSATTYANWAAKTAGVLVDDLMLDPGARVSLKLPTHWLGTVFVGAVLLAGMRLTHEDPDLTVTGPDQEAPDQEAIGDHLVTGLGPFAARLPDVPPGAVDFGALWPGQPDAFLGAVGTPDDPATDTETQAELLARVGHGDADRVLTDLNPCSPAGIDLFLSTLTPGRTPNAGRIDEPGRASPPAGASAVWVASPAPERWASRATSERISRTVRSD